MRKVIIVLMVMFSATGLTMDANPMKEAALKVCGTQLESVPEEMREASKKICECNVNNTDYAALLEVQKTGDTEKVQQDALDVAAACAKKAT